MALISGIRAIKLKEDLRQIADLIELCFSENIDEEGRDYIRHIRQTANNYSGFILENTTPENSSLPFHGYVWVEGTRIIGNLTLIPLRNKDKTSYFVANVAVHPDYRGRGIGRQLTERAVQHVREHHGKQIYLQVRQDNDIANRLYRNLGFEEICCRTTWLYRPHDPPGRNLQPEIQVTTRSKEDWGQQKLWLDELYPREIQWNIPFRLEKVEPSLSNWLNRFIYGEYQRTWSAHREGRLIGTITVERSSEMRDYCWLASSPMWEDQVIQSVLPVIQKKMWFPKRLAVNYPAGRGRASFELVGMQELNTLVWMKLKINSMPEFTIV